MKTHQKVKVVTLFETSSTISECSTQSHHAYSFYVPDGVSKLHLSFQYAPDLLEDLDKARTIVASTLEFYEGSYENESIEKYLPLRNLLTVSVDDPEQFRGACHRWASNQQLFLSHDEASPGLLNGSIQQGLWTVTISAHAIVTETCTYKLQIQGEREEEEEGGHYPWKKKTLQQDFHTVQRNISFNHYEITERLWVACELHAHTYHSDGKQTLGEMAAEAKRLGIEYVAVTDHNTTSPLQEKETVEDKTGIKIINGLEWTTFYGHMLTLGYRTAQYTDWRKVGPTNLKKGIKEVHDLGALAGIAHPFRIGNPVGTGCHWEFEMDCIEDFDYLEVWNGEAPSTRLYNQKAYELWTNLLNKGYRIPATSGRDWHENRGDDPLVAITYLHVPKGNDGEPDLLQSIREGRISVSMGPLLELSVFDGKDNYTVGDCINKKDIDYRFRVNVKPAEREIDRIDETSLTIKLVSNLGVIEESPIGYKSLEMSFFSDDVTWVRAELSGKIDNVERLIGFTNPVYFTH